MKPVSANTPIRMLSRIFGAVPLALLVSLPATAQQQAPAKPQSAQQSAKPAPAKPKPAKVWSDDDVQSLRSPADYYRDQKQADEAAADAATAQAAAAAKQAAAKPGPKDVAPPALSNPKTVGAADQMIAWENRDIAAQQDFARNLEQQLAAAPPDQKARLQKALDDRMKIIADTQKERDGLVAQRDKLQQKPADNGSVPQQPPQ